MVAFRRTQNLRSKLIKAKVPPHPPKRKKREQLGMKKCNQPRCEACPYILPGKEVQSPYCTDFGKINTALDCSSSNLVYGLFCDKENCRQLYIGKTVRNNQNKFNGPGHSLENLKITAIQKVFKRGTETILKGESLWSLDHSGAGHSVAASNVYVYEIYSAQK
jgi:hypothetical protein